MGKADRQYTVLVRCSLTLTRADSQSYDTDTDAILRRMPEDGQGDLESGREEVSLHIP